MSDREDSPEQMDNGGSPDVDDQHDDRSGSPQDSELESHRSANGHSPRPAGRSRSRSRSNARRYRKSRSRSGSRSKSRKYSSRHSPDSSSRRTKRSRSPMSSRRRHVGNREDPPSGRCLGIFGLSIYTQERDLKDVFSKYGPIEDVQIVYDAQTGRSRGFAFIYFEKGTHAVEAKDRCNGMEIDGRKIRVDFSITQRAHTPTPGIYMGKPTHSGGGGGGDRGGSSYNRGYRNSSGHGSGFGGGGGHSSSDHHRRRSPSPYRSYSSSRGRRGGHTSSSARFSRSRSRSFSPRKYPFKRTGRVFMSSYA
ncbi:transformer-2 protein homolog beta-like isoform X3 [Dermatophagoides pteronyssinus]|uniref:Transformer-2 protein homolog alpha-like isoform X3 n=1 Tax=Dermatophagoides pteronyssinus TaxID=6956 RepID=A0A6P6XXJ8_DERPT|nr:transformer-2 protein homolog alpha-like isoform X3 [Dermatophagoides pteronyssinus]